MPKGGFFAGIVVSLLLGIAGLLAFQLFQFENLERHFIQQSRQLQALGDATDRLTSEVEGLVRDLRAGGADLSARPGRRETTPTVNLRHADVENFLG